MIIDLESFIREERPIWEELDRLLKLIEADPAHRLEFEQIGRFHLLYQRTSADLGKVATFAAERELQHHLEQLVARAYSEIHAARRDEQRLRPLNWFWITFPTTFRRHVRAFYLSLTIFLVGGLFGALALLFDPSSKDILMPFPHLAGRPSERVAHEEEGGGTHLSGLQSTFSAQLMTHNIRVSILTFAMGMTYGLGTIIMLFYNGVILGAVGADYVADGQLRFLLGWLLPHGAIEIPAILLAGQGGLILANALIGWGRRIPLRRRLHLVAPDLVTLMIGLSLMLIWAGVVESFLSQYHQPVLPYGLKIAFGSVELMLLIVYLGRAGRAQLSASPGVTRL